MTSLKDLPQAAGAAIIKTYDEAFELLGSPLSLTGTFEPLSAPIRGGTLAEVDGDTHQVHRRLAAPLFGRKALNHYEERDFDWAIEAALDDIRSRDDSGVVDGVDLVHLSELILVRLAARFIGLNGVDDAETSAELLGYATVLGPGVELRWTEREKTEVIRDALAAKQQFATRFYRPARSQRTGDPGAGDPPPEPRQPDLIGQLVHGTDWDEDLMLREAIVYLTAGTRATAHIVTCTFEELERWLLDNPDERVRAYSPNGLRAACNETLRLHPSSPALFRRAADRIVRHSGETIEPGGLIAIDMVACNTDPAVFGEHPERFDPDREIRHGVPRYGLSFGAGKHVCVGRPLVSSSGPVDEGDTHGHERAVLKILERFYEYGIEMDESRQPVRNPNTQQVRYEYFPVRFTRLNKRVPLDRAEYG